VDVLLVLVLLLGVGDSVEHGRTDGAGGTLASWVADVWSMN
jgi:hypothetical protein